MDNNLNEAIVIEVNAGSPRLAEIEELFEKVIDSDGKDSMALDKIRKLFNLEFRPIIIEDISIVPSPDPKDFFVAQVMPAVDYIESIVAKGLSIKDIKAMPGPERLGRCNIEIDQRVITDCNFTGRELMAIILHELGHTLSDKKLTIPKMFCLDTILALPTAVVSSVKAVAFSGGIYCALGGFLVASILTLYSRSGRYWFNLGREKEADSVAVKCGFGKDLYSATDKLIASNLLQSSSKSSEKDAAKRMAKWGFGQVKHLRQRQSAIIRLLRSELKNEASPSARLVLLRQIQALEESQKSKPAYANFFGGGMKFGYNESMDIALNESIRSFLEIHRQGISPLEVDEIEVEIGRIETSDDKLYLVQRIHKDIVIANKAIAKLSRSSNPVDKARIETINQYIDDLKALLPKIKAVKTEIVPYNIVIKYPKGDYEEGSEYLK